MRDSIAVRKWLDEAASGIRFGPDRAEVKAELLEHIEDKTADLQRVFPGLEEREAQERALAAMGDAWELKTALARVHRPWLGYVWTASRVLVWIMLAAGLLFGGACGLEGLSRGDFAYAVTSWRANEEQRALCRALYEDGVPGWEGERLSVFAPGARLRLDGAVLSVPRAAWWREGGKERLYLQTGVVWDRPWEVNERIFFRLWAEDDLGNRYPLGEDSRVNARGWWDQGLRGRWMNLYLDDISPRAGEIHLHSELRDGVDLTVKLEREVEP